MHRCIFYLHLKHISKVNLLCQLIRYVNNKLANFACILCSKGVNYTFKKTLLQFPCWSKQFMYKANFTFFKQMSILICFLGAPSSGQAWNCAHFLIFSIGNSNLHWYQTLSHHCNQSLTCSESNKDLNMVLEKKAVIFSPSLFFF